ncbi:DNA-processing protein DprA [Yoonia litorea]|uniref:DNA protecting protein DprA n=1 Tax=Yoonia litorea TaxID=1123755 RepID=A0A1I6N208_9RHOB|nr:DNA-processing protein DprA [Yoonia litorea]SFS22005.1 DNA protecting protein DprA [Yoonia litorea]
MTGTSNSSDSPPPQPSPEDDAIDRLRLLRSRRVGVATYKRLIGEHGSATAALAALPDIARAAGVDDYQACSRADAIAEMRRGRAAGARLIFNDGQHYPNSLTEIADAPPLFWALGDLSLLARPAVAIVGARNASSLGLRMARRLAADLADAGLVVVSGLARGIDKSAHEGALQKGTIAVQAGGVDVIYPNENAKLAAEIAKTDLRLSEMPMGLEPRARHFPARNRIISGLARAVVVVEAAAKSGSLITARNALDYGRDVLAVPGHPFDARAWGCNMLIRDGATLVRDAEDVIEAIRILPSSAAPEIADLPVVAQPTRSLRQTAKLHRLILDRLGPSPVSEDQLLRDVQVPSAEATPVLVDMELAGEITRTAGGMLARPAG